MYPIDKELGSSVSVLIAGAGPTGLALACDLRRRGVDARVLDRLEKAAVTTRALGLQPRGRQIIERIGALGDLPKEALSQTGFDVYVDRRLAVSVAFDALKGSDDEGTLRVPQTTIERHLRERLRELGEEVRWGHEVIGCTQDTTGVEVTVRARDGEHRMRADWLIGCDGAHSTVRKLIDAAFDGTASRQTFLLGDVRLDWKRKNGAAIYLHRDQVLSMASLPEGMWRIGVALPEGDPLAEAGHDALTVARDASAVASEPALTRLRQLFQEYSGDGTTRISDPTWFSVFRINRRMASSFRRSYVLIAGDAAHLTSPLGGQGMNTGLSDAFNLGWKLTLVVGGRADERLLDSYEAERRPATERIDRATMQWTHVLLGDSRASRILRRYVVLPAMHLRFVQAWILTRRGDLQSTYRGGPLAPQTSSALRTPLRGRGPQPGDEAPDSRCMRRGHLEPTRLGKEIGPNWGLLFFGGDEHAIAACTEAARSRLPPPVRVLRIAARDGHRTTEADGVIDDRFGAIRRGYRPAKTTTLLIRPDGYLAWRSGTPDAAGLTWWLEDVLGVGRAAGTSGGPGTVSERGV
jgi:4,5-epoxidase